MSEKSLATNYEFIRTKNYKKMQNEPNFKIGKMHTTIYLKRSYGKLCAFEHQKNEPNQTQC